MFLNGRQYSVFYVELEQVLGSMISTYSYTAYWNKQFSNFASRSLSIGTGLITLFVLMEMPTTKEKSWYSAYAYKNKFYM